MNKIAIITGAGGGLGEEFVKILALDVSLTEIWVMARSADKLRALRERYGSKIRPYPIDLTERDKLAELSRLLKKETPDISFLVNCAGFGKFCSYSDIDVGTSLSMTDLNVQAVVAMSLICLPYMQRGAHIINVSSQASFQPLPGLNIYAATKVFVRYYSRALHRELAPRGISVTAVCPGWMKTPFLDIAKVSGASGVKSFSGGMHPAYRVAERAVSAARRGKPMSVYGFFPKLTHIGTKLLPQSAVMKMWERMQK